MAEDTGTAEVVATETPGTSTTVTPPAGTPDPQKTSSPSPQVTAPDRKAEDERNRGILADLQKERRQRQALEGEARQYKADLAREQQRVRAMAGLDPVNPEDADNELIRQRINKIYPELAGLTKDDIQAIRDMREDAAGLKEATAHHYRMHGRKMLDSTLDAVGKQLGGTLTTRQINRIERAYFQEASDNPEFLKRHDAGDPKLVEEFVKDLMEDFFEPARRRVTQTEVERQRRVPSGRDRSVASTGGKKLDFNDPKAVEDALVASFKEHGGAFGE